jgi:prevent-host-death family protein
MKTATVSKLKMSLSEYLACAKAGEEVVVTERGRPVARLSPIDAMRDSAGYMAKLAREGLVKPPSGVLDRRFWDIRRPRDPRGSLLRSLLREREDGR